MMSLAYKISHCLSANHNPELRCVICTGVTVSYRIRFKVLLLTYKALNDLSPEYISELLSKPKCTRYLRSQSQHLLSVPKSSTVTYGDRAFSVCAPKLWNELPFQLRMLTNIQAFKSGLKTMLFKMAYF